MARNQCIWKPADFCTFRSLQPMYVMATDPGACSQWHAADSTKCQETSLIGFTVSGPQWTNMIFLTCGHAKLIAMAT
eukprot:scaffold242450_cov22-Prasinocladus_malaysianus.AAC.2